MCFSAEASFTASAVLGVIGVITIKKAKEPSQMAFASIPLLFSFQQFTEGMLWLALLNKEFAFLQSIATYLFLIIAQIIWPTWVPLSILFLEKEILRKKVLYIILGMGGILSLYLTYCYIFYDIQAEISDHHINYNLNFPHEKNFLWLSAIFYFVPTVISTIVSSVKRMQILGMIVLVSGLLTGLFALKYFISIWCFFAAIISVLILMIITQLQKKNNQKFGGGLPATN